MTVLDTGASDTLRISSGNYLSIEAWIKMQTAQPDGAEMLKLQIATWMFIICWVLSIIDSFRLGQIADKQIADQRK